MRLRCIGRYSNSARGIAYEVGHEFDASPDLAGFLAADSPLCFVVVDLPAQTDTAVTAPEVDTAADAPTVDRVVRRGRKPKSDEDSAE